MLGPTRMERLARRVLALSGAEQTEVVLLAQDSALTRFAGSRIHQNVAESNIEVRVRVLDGMRAGVASVNDLADGSLRQAARNALSMARLQSKNPGLGPLPAPRTIPHVNCFARATADCTPHQRAGAVATICKLASDRGLIASGALSTATVELTVANSFGVIAYCPSTVAELSTVVMSDDSSGFALATSMDFRDIDAEQVGCEAVDKALRSRNPRPLAPGHYTVILEEYAVAEMVSTLSYLGFSAQGVQEGRSFMAGRLGQSVTGESISIWDDGLDETGLPCPFDFEGTPKTRVDLIKEGIAVAAVHDSQTAHRDGTMSTGHALPAPNSYGPLPANLFMAPGTMSRQQMLSRVNRGIWVTRFHYVNAVHPLRTTLTGMTRDGTFWIEGGELCYGLKNLRFTQGVLDAFATVRAAGSHTRLLPGMPGSVRVPALCIDDFSFTGATEF